MRMGSREPSEDELRTWFAYVLAVARDEGLSLTDIPLDFDTTSAVTAVADAYPDPSAELIVAAEAAFAGMLDGTNAQRRAEQTRARLLGN
ncbi:hypothetical protein [Nocardia sp. NPDC060249]|uniref:hypothetical protein n=1 Tax=Nocardia sp. NPDC060249 TaxID=3347082 RepID=UPI003658B574